MVVKNLKKRNNVWNKIVALFSAGVLLLSLSGCNTRETSVDYLIGVSLANLSEQWRLVLKQELESEAEKYENIRLVFSDAAGSTEKQKEDIRRLLEYGIDLLIVSPADVEQLNPVITDVYAQLPVIVLDRAVEGYDYSLFIGPDNQQIGRQAGEAVKSLLEAEGISEPSVLELTTEGYASEERSETFAEVMEEASVQLTEISLRNPTRDSTEDLLLDDPDLLSGVHVIFAHNDYMAYGARLALDALGITDVYVVGLDGFDGRDGGLELVKQGLIDATVTCPTGGREAIQSAMEILTYTSGVPKQIILRSHTLTKDNVERYIEKQAQPVTQVTTPPRVGYVQIAEASSWRNANAQSIAQAARDFGVDLTMVQVEPEVEKQVEQVRQFIAEKMDIIVISPVVETGWEEVLQEAKDAGIPILLSDRKVDVPIDLYTAFIGADFLEQGRRCASWLMQSTAEKEQVRVLEIQGTRGASPTRERKLGFEMKLGDDPRYEIVYSDYGDFDQDGGRRVIQTYLNEHEWDIDAIYCHNDDMAIGAIDVLKENGIEPGEDVLIMSIDGTSQALDALKKGEINCVAECNPLLGPQLMKAITDLMSNKELPLRIITDEVVFTSETPKKAFQNRKY